MTMSENCLKMILIYINSEYPNTPLFRTLVDDWHAFETRGPFLSKNGRPKWFNNPNAYKERDALLSMHYRSAEAERIILEAKPNTEHEKLIKDHTVPISILKNIIIKEKPKNAEEISLLLKKFYRIAIITKKEDNILNNRKLKSQMPPNWNWKEDAPNLKARYDLCEIKILT